MFKTRKYLCSAVISMEASQQCWGQEEEPTVQEEQLQLLRLLIGLKMSLKFFDQWEAKPSPIAPWKGELSHPLSASYV